MFQELPKPPWDLTENDLLALIEDGTPEGQHLEFKGFGMLPNKDKTAEILTKAVSAFSNAEGGTVLIGIETGESKSHIPIGLDGGPYSPNITQTWISQIVQSNIDSFVERPVRDGPWSARVSGREAPRAVGC